MLYFHFNLKYSQNILKKYTTFRYHLQKPMVNDLLSIHIFKTSRDTTQAKLELQWWVYGGRGAIFISNASNGNANPTPTPTPTQS